MSRCQTSMQGYTVNKKPFSIYRAGQKRGHRLMTTILSILNRFKIFFTGRFLGKFAVKRISEIPPHLTYVATLPCETLMSAKQTINDKLQGSVATYLRCGGVVNNQIKKDLPRNLPAKKFWNRLKIDRIMVMSLWTRFWPTLYIYMK